MPTRSASVTVLLGLFVATTQVAPAADEVPLPKGAVLRIGNPKAVRTAANDLAFSPDGKWMYVRETLNTIRPINLRDGTRGRPIKGPTPQFFCCVSPDGRWLAEREAWGTIRLWDAVASSRERVWTLDGSVLPFVFTPDAKFLVGVHFPPLTKSGDRVPPAVVVWDVSAEKPARRFDVDLGTGAGVSNLILSPDGKRIAVAGTESPVIVYDFATGRKFATLGGTGGFAHLVGFRGNDRVVVGSGKSVSEYDLAKPDAAPVVTELPGRRVAAVSPDGSRVAVQMSELARFRVCDTATGKEVSVIGDEYKNAGRSPQFSPDGKVLAVVVGQDYSTFVPTRFWDTATGNELFANPGHPVPVRSLLFLDGGKTLASTAADDRLRFWDAASGKPQKPFDLAGSDLEASRDGGRFLVIAKSGAARVYESEGRKLLADFPGEDYVRTTLSPDGKLVVRHTNNWLRVHNADTEVRVRYGKHMGTIVERGFAFGPDNATMYAQMVNGRLEANLLLPKEPVWVTPVETAGFARSPDGKLTAAFIRHPDRVAILDAVTFKEVANFKTKVPTPVAWSADGNWVACGEGPVLTVWSAATGKTRISLAGHDDDIAAIAFAPDGKSIATGGKDNLLYVWNLPAP